MIWWCGIELKWEKIENENESFEYNFVDWNISFELNDISESFEEDKDHEWHSRRSI